MTAVLSVPTRVTTYLGRLFAYPADSLIGDLVDRGVEWDAILRPIIASLVPAAEPSVCEVGSNIGASLLQILRETARARLRR